MGRIKRKLRKITASVLDLPQDVVFDLPRVTMIGDMQLYVENHKGVQQFSSEMLRLSLSKGVVEVHGKNFVIRSILTEEMFIEGEIKEVKYVN